MPVIAIVIGLLLSAIGAVGYLKPEMIGAVGPEGTSFTALIPVFFGVALILCGGVSLAAPHLRKHAMHAGAAIGMLGLLGALMRPLMKLFKGEALDFGAAPLRSQLAMALLCIVFLWACIRSFIAARKAREAKGGE